jgi:hypothetical protein
MTTLWVRLLLLSVLVVAECRSVSAYVAGPCRRQPDMSLGVVKNEPLASENVHISRRSFGQQALQTVVGVAVVGSVIATSGSALAADTSASVTTTQFEAILRDSSRSISRVEFTGPLSTTVTVKLIDGTSFTIRDVVESSTDPRSPLKIAASCREFAVPTAYPDIVALLASSPRKRKVYTNERVQEAQRKEKERQDRMQQDERERLAELYRMEGGGTSSPP